MPEEGLRPSKGSLAGRRPSAFSPDGARRHPEQRLWLPEQCLWPPELGHWLPEQCLCHPEQRLWPPEQRLCPPGQRLWPPEQCLWLPELFNQSTNQPNKQVPKQPTINQSKARASDRPSKSKRPCKSKANQTNPSELNKRIRGHVCSKNEHCCLSRVMDLILLLQIVIQFWRFLFLCCSFAPIASVF